MIRLGFDDHRRGRNFSYSLNTDVVFVNDRNQIDLGVGTIVMFVSYGHIIAVGIGGENA